MRTNLFIKKNSFFRANWKKTKWRLYLCIRNHNRQLILLLIYMIKKLFFILGSHIFHTERFFVISLFRNDLHLFIARIKFLLKPSQQDVY